MDKKMPKFAKRLLVIVPCAIAALIVVAGCFDIVPAGYKGVKLTMGAVGDTVLNEGLAFKLPFAQRIVHVDARVKKYTVEGETSEQRHAVHHHQRGRELPGGRGQRGRAV